ncbi:MAG: hypothetical protein NTW03_04030 [Verrucomicrobia bacterium]|nr:hypothetical protein [Verrucomicrobiota bacterium]
MDAARVLFNQGLWRAGISELQVFQRRVHEQLARAYPSLARRWIGQAQTIIDALQVPQRAGPDRPAPGST